MIFFKRLTACQYADQFTATSDGRPSCLPAGLETRALSAAGSCAVERSRNENRPLTKSVLVCYISRNTVLSINGLLVFYPAQDGAYRIFSPNPAITSEHKPLVADFPTISCKQFRTERRVKVNYVIDNIGARRAHPRETVAGRPGRALADRTADTLCDNPRLHSEADLDKIAASILKWGWTNPVLVDEQGVLIAGHGRAGCSGEAGAEIHPGDRRARAGAKRRSRPIAWPTMNWRRGRAGTPICSAMSCGDLKFSGFDLDLIGFEPDRLEDILAGLGSSGLTDPDSTPEVPENPGHSVGRHMVVGRSSDRLRRQHQRGGCRASAGGSAASPDGHRSALWRRL